MDLLPVDTDIEDRTSPDPERSAVISQREEEQRAKNRHLLLLLARLSMWSARHPRNLVAIAIMTFEISVESKWYKAVHKAMEKWERICQVLVMRGRNMEEVENLISLPHDHAFYALAKKALAGQPETQQRIEQAMKNWVEEQRGISKLLEYVPHVRLAKMRQPQKAQLEIAVPTYQTFKHQPFIPVWVVIRQEMEKDGVRMLRGKALRGHMESEITTWVEEQE